MNMNWSHSNCTNTEGLLSVWLPSTVSCHSMHCRSMKSAIWLRYLKRMKRISTSGHTGSGSFQAFKMEMIIYIRRNWLILMKWLKMTFTIILYGVRECFWGTNSISSCRRRILFMNWNSQRHKSTTNLITRHRGCIIWGYYSRLMGLLS